ncbi:MAG: hypothetical protein IKN05_06285, partial [Clostridia bacterium]|nr:hypothetical protein [Clostridia bacterium]
ATVGIGGVAVNAGVGLAINRLKQETGIRSGATVSGNIADVNVNATSVTNSDALLLGVSVGGAPPA